MNNQSKIWEILHEPDELTKKNIIKILLKNRGVENEEEFFNPPSPINIPLSDVGIKKTEVRRAIKTIIKAKNDNELVFIYGDYDADGITATAILWETLHSLGVNVLPFIPDRFEDGYGIKKETVEKLKNQNPSLKLIITVDNGIVGYEGIDRAKELGVDVIVLDHHVKGVDELKASSVIHTTALSGSGIAWFFSREILNDFKTADEYGFIKSELELAAIGTLADQLSLIGPNRSIVKHGLSELNETKRPGLIELFDEAGVTVSGIKIKPVSTYEVGYIIAPRINAMGRLKHGVESLRLLCTKDRKKAREIAKHIGSVNLERQQMVETVMSASLSSHKGLSEKIIVIASESYHEGVIGLAAGRLTEEFYRPAIVLSVRGKIAKGSARSVAGFDIISNIRSLSSLILEGGGHPMAAGFSIKTENIDKFTQEINKLAEKSLTSEILERKLRIDCELKFDQIDFELSDGLKEFEPIGMGNPAPSFCSTNVEIIESKKVGSLGKHFKLKLKQGVKILDAIWFNGATICPELSDKRHVDVAYNIEENVWNLRTSLQLKIKDLKLV